MLIFYFNQLFPNFHFFYLGEEFGKQDSILDICHNVQVEWITKKKSIVKMKFGYDFI